MWKKSPANNQDTCVCRNVRHEVSARHGAGWTRVPRRILRTVASFTR
jgi:hypothetical protein